MAATPRDRITIFCEMSTLASHMVDHHRGDPIGHAEHAKQMNVLRGELCRSHGVPEEYITEDGYDITQRAYEHVRDSWVYHLRQWNGSDWYRDGAREAHALWMGHRPDLAEGDDWFARAGIES